IAPAIARPIPREAPVTSATLPSNLSSMGRTLGKAGDAGSGTVGPWAGADDARFHPRTVSPMNRLADETSPYLRQHADNPVDWYPWGDEAFAAAKARDVPILLSVGYSACHWCHVMAHESFEDDDTAALMNELVV